MSPLLSTISKTTNSPDEVDGQQEGKPSWKYFSTVDSIKLRLDKSSGEKSIPGRAKVVKKRFREVNGEQIAL